MVYIGKNGKAASASAIKIGDENGKAQNVVGGWVGDENGKARRIWSLDRPFWKFTCSDYIELTVSGKNIEIDFGDGTVMDLGNPVGESIPHDFQDAETHQVTIYGVMSYIIVGGEISSIDTPFPRNKIVSFNSTFSNCTSLSAIPAGLFDNCPNVTTFRNTFSGCTSLASIPAGLFDNCTAVTDFSNAFYNCTAITSAVPELWDTVKWPNATRHSSCFYNCTHAANYADIPEGWK